MACVFFKIKMLDSAERHEYNEYGEHTNYGTSRIGMDNGTTISYYVYNGHGDTTKLTDSAGLVQADYIYDAFGNQQGEDADFYNSFRYSGEYFDEETDVIYLRNHYYDHDLSRNMI